MFGTGGNLRSAAVVLFTFAAASFGQPTEARAACVHSRRPGHRAELDWGDDVLVGSVDSGFSIVDLSTDADTNGDIYVTAVARSTASGDILHAWRSTNGGTDWTDIYRIRSDTSTGGINDHSIIVGHDASGTWLYDFVLRDHEGPAGGLWLLRHRPPMQDSIWLRIAPGGDTLMSFSADRNIESPEHLFVAWETESGNVYATGSKDSGQTWLLPRLVHTEGSRPSLCAGGDGCVYVAAARRDSAWISVARLDDNLHGSLLHLARLDSVLMGDVQDVSVGADRDSPCSLQAVVAVYILRDDSGRFTPRLGWTRNGGASWGTTLWPPANRPGTTWESRSPHVRRSYDDVLFRAAVVMQDSNALWDTLLYAVTRSVNPTVWEQRLAPNDTIPVPELGARVGFSRTTRGGYMVYVPIGRSTVLFDGYGYVGLRVGDRMECLGARTAATLGTDPVVRMYLDRAATGRVQLYDPSGRLVRKLHEGTFGPGEVRLAVDAHGLPGGVYLCRVETPDWSQGLKLVVAK